MYFTEKQLRIMQFIQQFRAERGISPTLEEIAENFGVTKITIYEHINQLERKGALKREKFRARSIELLVPVEERKDRFSMPLVGELSGTAPLDTTPESSEAFSLTEFLPLGKNCYALRVQGDAMACDHITDGDLVIVEKREAPVDGETVVVHLDTGTTIKKYFGADEGVRLTSTNGGEGEILTKEAEIRGVVIGVLRRFGE
ncbi:MAG: transcriptional repressor LexA [Planctomycetota bacterium]